MERYGGGVSEGEVRAELFEEQVERTPEAVAVVYEERAAELRGVEPAGEPAGALSAGTGSGAGRRGWRSAWSVVWR